MINNIEKLKQNPSISLDRECFVNEIPTKQVDTNDKIEGIENTYGMKKKAERLHLIPILTGVAISFLLIVLLILFIGLFSNGYFSGNRTSYLQTPNLVGKSFTAVKADVQYKNFAFQEKNTEYSDTYAAGTIVSQSPSPAETVQKGSLINLFVSIGPPQITVPDVATDEQSQAISILKSAGFNNVQTSEMYDSSIAIGYVIKTNPTPNMNEPASTAVTVYVSEGPDPSLMITVPDLTGLTYDTAKSILEQSGLVIGNQTSQISAQTINTIISQNPISNSQVSKNTVIDVVISSGKNNVVVSSGKNNVVTSNGNNNIPVRGRPHKNRR